MQKMIVGNFDILIFADFTAAEIQKMPFFKRLSSRTTQKIAKNQNLKNSHDHFVELYLRINHAKFYIDWIIFQRLVAILVLKKS